MKRTGLIELPFVGRQEEVSILKEKFESTLENRGCCILVTGAAGIGKSRLADEFLVHEQRDVLKLSVKVRPHTASAREFFAEFIQSCLHKTSNIGRIITRVIDNRLFCEFAETVPVLKTYYPYEAQMTFKERTSDIPAMFYHLIDNLSNLSPVIIVIDDLHESKDDLLALLKYVVQNMENLPAFVVLISRNDPRINEWSKTIHPHICDRLVLSSLHDADIVQINEQLFHNDIEDTFFQWLGTRTAGNPLFIRQFLFTLLEKGIIFFDGEGQKWDVVGSYTKIAIPDSVTEVVTALVRGLPDEQISFLKRAAMIGSEFDLSTTPLETTARVLSALVKSGFMKTKDGTYEFTHPLVWEVIYNSVPEKERQKFHKQLGDRFLKAENMKRSAEQYLRAQTKSRRIVSLLLTLSEQARDAGDFAQCAFYAERALSMAESLRLSDKTTTAIMFNYLTGLCRAGKFVQTVDIAQALLRRLSVHPGSIAVDKHATVYRYLSQACLLLGRFQETVKTAEKGVRFINMRRMRGALEILIELERSRAFAHKNLGNNMKALRIALRMKDKMATPANTYALYQTQSLIGAIYDGMHDYEKALKYRGEALRAAQLLHDESMVADAKGNLGICYTNSGQFAQGLKYLVQYQSYNKKIGRVRSEAVSYLLIAYNHFYQGYLVKAENEYRKGFKIARECGAQAELVWCESFYGILLLFMDRHEEAQLHLERSVQLAKELGMRDVQFNSMVDLGLLLCMRNDKAGSDQLIIEISRDFKDKYKGGGILSILQGFCSIRDGNTEAGLKKIDDGLALHEKARELPLLFRYLLMCAHQLATAKRTAAKANTYLHRAVEIAQKLNMSGWLERLQPGSKAGKLEPLKIRCLGQLEVEHPIKGLIGAEEWTRLKPKQLLSAILVATIQNQQVNREKIGVVIWPEFSSEKMSDNFGVCLAQLRKIIGAEYVVYKDGNYRMDNVTVDVIGFRILIKNAEKMLNQGKVHLAEMKLQEAIAYYRGDFLEDSYDIWLDELRGQLSQLYRKALLMLGEICLQKSKFDTAIDLAQSILNSDSFDEQGHRLLIRSYYQNGEKSKAINQYNRCVELLRREFKCQPSDQTQLLYKNIIS